MAGDDDGDEAADPKAAGAGGIGDDAGAPLSGSITIAAEDAGQRLDRVLSARMAHMSRSRLQALMRAGAVTRDGAPVRELSLKVRAGETYAVDVPAALPAGPGPEAIPLSVVYEDRHLIVIDKPSGVTVHPAPGHPTGTLVNALIAHCGESLSGIGGVKRPGIVHRLDKNTTGLMVVAKNDAAHRGLAEQFEAHGADGRLVRGYRALVWGMPERVQGMVAAPIGRSRLNRTKMAAVGETFGRRAVTHYEVMEGFAMRGGKAQVALLKVTLETGRTHQVRVHMAHIGHPLLGDMTYGAGFKASARNLSVPAQAALAALGRQALHAADLGFVHPVSGKRLSFHAELPADMAELVAALA